MGRAKLNMELIPKKKSRHTTFKKRKDGLIKKMHELTTLCDVQACMIIYGPKQDEMGLPEPETWPQNTDEVRAVIDIYKHKSKDSNNKTFGLSDFFDDRQRKIEDELSRLKKKNRELKYPTRPEFMNFMTEEVHLREFAASLVVDKARIVRSRIEFLRINNNQLGVDLSANHHNNYYPTIDHHQNPTMMLLMNDHVQFGPGPSSGGGSSIQCASYERQVFYEGMVDPTAMICQNPMQLARYYGPTLPPVPYMHVMPQASQAAVSSYMQMPSLPEMHFPAKAESGEGQEDNVTRQYGMMSHKESSSYD